MHGIILKSDEEEAKKYGDRSVTRWLETWQVDLNFEALTGKQLADAEKEARAMGDQSPSVLISMLYHSIIVAKILGVPVDDVLSMNAVDYKALITETAAFFLQ